MNEIGMDSGLSSSSSLMTCPICHNEEHPEGARFCMICGAPLEGCPRAVPMRAPAGARTVAELQPER